MGRNWSEPPEGVAIELGRAFPSYQVTVRWDHGEPRFQLVSKNDINPYYCLISPDAEEIRAVLNGDA
jgi:hypothetical protein